MLNCRIVYSVSGCALCLLDGRDLAALLSSLFGFLVVALIILAGIAFYFLPTIVAGLRHKRNTASIFLLNLLAGWTFVGWVVAIVWAATEDPPPPNYYIAAGGQH